MFAGSLAYALLCFFVLCCIIFPLFFVDCLFCVFLDFFHFTLRSPFTHTQTYTLETKHTHTTDGRKHIRLHTYTYMYFLHARTHLSTLSHTQHAYWLKKNKNSCFFLGICFFIWSNFRAFLMLSFISSTLNFFKIV